MRWPFGAVGLITPFNFPLEIPALQALGALFMGNKPLIHVDHRHVPCEETSVCLCDWVGRLGSLSYIYTTARLVGWQGLCGARLSHCICRWPSHIIWWPERTSSDCLPAKTLLKRTRVADQGVHCGRGLFAHAPCVRHAAGRCRYGPWRWHSGRRAAATRKAALHPLHWLTASCRAGQRFARRAGACRDISCPCSSVA